MKIKVITLIAPKGFFFGHDDITKDLNNKIDLWKKEEKPTNPRLMNSTVFTDHNGDAIYQVHIAHD